MAAIQSMQIDGGTATTTWQTLYALCTHSNIPALPEKVREVVIVNRDATSYLYIATSRADGTAPGVTSGDFLLTERLIPDTNQTGQGGYSLTRGSKRSVNTKEILLACNTNAGETTCAFSVKTTGV